MNHVDCGCEACVKERSYVEESTRNEIRYLSQRVRIAEEQYYSNLNHNYEAMDLLRNVLKNPTDEESRQKAVARIEKYFGKNWATR